MQKRGKKCCEKIGIWM